MSSVLFVGDIAIGPNETDFPPVPWLPDCTDIVANLEGALLGHGDDTALWNHESTTLAYMTSMGVSAVSLANNHIFDYGTHQVSNTVAALHRSQILPFGVTGLGTAPSVHLVDSGVTVVGLGWKLIGCRPAGRGRPGIIDISSAESVVSLIKAADFPAPWIPFVHWGYEFEGYPHPVHRYLARRLIDLGAEAVIGTHPHLVQGVECWKGKPIAYSLGNWSFQRDFFFGGSLSFPAESAVQLAFEWSSYGDHQLHWYEAGGSGLELNYKRSVRLNQGAAQLAVPFADMAMDEYSYWYKRNRLRRGMLPPMLATDGFLVRSAKYAAVQARQSTARVLKPYIRRGQSE